MKKKPLACTMKDEEGQGMVKCGLIIALVAVMATVGLIVLGPKIKELFDNIAGNLKTPTETTPL